MQIKTTLPDFDEFESVIRHGSVLEPDYDFAYFVEFERGPDTPKPIQYAFSGPAWELLHSERIPEHRLERRTYGHREL